MFTYWLDVTGTIGLVYLYLLEENMYRVNTHSFKYYFVSLSFFLKIKKIDVSVFP